MRAILAATLLLLATVPAASAGNLLTELVNSVPDDSPQLPSDDGPHGGAGGCGAPKLDHNELPFDSWTVGFCTFTFNGIAPSGNGWVGITSAAGYV